MKTTIRILSISIISLTMSISTATNFLLSPPENTSQYSKHSFSTCFTWGNLENAMAKLSFSYKNEKSALQMTILRPLINELTLDEKNKFECQEIEIHGSKDIVFLFQQGGDKNTFSSLDTQQKEHGTYYLARPLSYKNTTAKNMEVDDLIQIIKTKNILFYTGAGISATKIWTMNELEHNLQIAGLFDQENKTNIIRNILENHELIREKFSEFSKAMFTKKPTVAHIALKDIATIKSTQILTENEDRLHEGTGIKPLRVDAEKFKSNITTESLQEIDVIICIGLSHDDKGFLGWYLQHNPKGNIIAIDLVQPNYLSENGFFVQEDLQVILPQIKQSLEDFSK